MAKPQLTNYPTLYQLLRSNHQANTEFNAYVSAINKPGVQEAREHELQDSIKALEIRAQELQQRALKAETVLQKGVRFVKILGELMETQLQLTPYTQDVREAKHYDIRFSADQVRLATRWYWDVLANSMETTLTRGAPDPADDPEEP